MLEQTADDVRIENFVVECTRTDGTFLDPFANDEPAAYYPDSNLPNTVVRNCKFVATDEVNGAFSTRYTDIALMEYAGYYENVESGIQSFANIASGTFKSCTAGDFSFGGGGGVSGTFIDCTGGQDSFTGASNNAYLEGCVGSGVNVFRGTMEDCRWESNLTLRGDARVYRSTILGNVNLSNESGGVAQCTIRGTINNSGNAAFNTANVEDPDVD